MAGFGYCSNEDLLGIDPSLSESSDSWSHQAFPFPQFTAEDDLLALEVSALPVHSDPISVINNWPLMQDHDSLFPDRRCLSDEQQNSKLISSASWFTWDVCGTSPVEHDTTVPHCVPYPEWSHIGLTTGVFSSFMWLQNQNQPHNSMSSGASSHIAQHSLSNASASSSPNTSEDSISFHGSISTESDKQCNECNILFPTKTALYQHSKVTNHSPHICLCGKGFSRLDVLERHIQSRTSPESTFPCPHCHKYRGTTAFRRRDHLTQHLKGYHHMESLDTDKPSSASHSEHSNHHARKRKEQSILCTHKSCSDGPKAASSQLRTRSQLTQHLREVHNESLFPCDEPRCSRVGGRGFFRRRDLIKHAKEHEIQRTTI